MRSVSFTLRLYHQVCQGSDLGGGHRLFGEKVPGGDLRYRSGPLEVVESQAREGGCIASEALQVPR